MAMRQLRPLGVLALQQILSSEGTSSEGSFFAGVRPFYTSSLAGRGSAGASSSSEVSVFAGSSSSARSASRSFATEEIFFVGVRPFSTSSLAGRVFAGASSSSAGSVFAGSSSSSPAPGSSFAASLGRSLHTSSSARTKGGFPTPKKYVAAIAILAFASSSIYMKSRSKQATEEYDSQFQFDEETQELMEAYRVDKFLEHYKMMMTQNRADVPKSVDWVKAGAVVGVKNQGDTDACVMCTVLSAVEAKHKIVTGQAIELSVQHLIDCTGYGCKGGSAIPILLRFVTKEGCFSSYQYPFTGKLGPCKSKDHPVAVRVNGYFTLTPTEENLMFAVSIQPTIAKVYCSKEFNDFKGGRTLELADCLVDETSDQEGMYTHAVLVVAYGEDEEGLYWLILNSWGEEWGDKGFAKLRRGVADSKGRGVAGLTAPNGCCFLPVLD